jgi:hypothetical protein
LRFDFLIFLGNEAKPEPEKASEIGMDETIVIHNEMEDVGPWEVVFQGKTEVI